MSTLDPWTLKDIPFRGFTLPVTWTIEFYYKRAFMSG
jgi:hypothetical protein